MGYRERREQKAEKLREWADKRKVKANAISKADASIRSELGFVAAQPGIGRLPVFKRMNAREEKEWEHRGKAGEMEGRAAGIEAQLDRSIYSDDDDASERLEERIAELEAKRERIKAENATYRKAHPELKALGVYARDCAMPHPGWELTNLTGNITRQKKRLEDLKRRAERQQQAEDNGGVSVHKSNGYGNITFADYPGRPVTTALKAAGWWYGGGSWAGKLDDLPFECPPDVDPQTWARITLSEHLHDYHAQKGTLVCTVCGVVRTFQEES